MAGVNIDQIAMRFISTDSCQRALQTIGKFLFEFRISFRIFDRKLIFFQINS